MLTTNLLATESTCFIASILVGKSTTSAIPHQNAFFNYEPSRYPLVSVSLAIEEDAKSRTGLNTG